jgi:F-type H+-transporting ATPase subunit gamma
LRAVARAIQRAQRAHGGDGGAEDLRGALQLEYNKARQLAITSEILDIIGGVEALKQGES